MTPSSDFLILTNFTSAVYFILKNIKWKYLNHLNADTAL